MIDFDHEQKNICLKFNSPFHYCDLSLKVGISQNIRDGVRPINGLRVKEERGTTGWYIWAGDWVDDPEFFLPIHGYHLPEWAEIVMPYLGLSEGWRFLLTEDYEDVWYDSELAID